MAEQIPLKAVKSSGVATALAEMEAGDYSAAAYLPPVFSDYIGGLAMEWVDGTSLRVTSGNAYVPSLGYVINSPSAITKSSLALATSTWYHVYLFSNAGAPDVEIVTTAPSAPYSGSARAKSADTSRRYIGSVRTDGAGNIKPFTHCSTTDEVLYANNSDFVVSNGVASVSTPVDCSPNAPVTAISAKCLMGNGSATVFCYYNGTIAGPVSTSNYTGVLPPNNNLSPDVPLNTSQQFQYFFESVPPGNGLFVRVYGYKYER